MKKFGKILSTAIALIITIVSFGQTNYYSKSTGTLDNVTSWGTNPDGSGTAPSSFGIAAYFNISNRTSVTLANDWTVSNASAKVILGSNVVMTIPSGKKLTAKLDLSSGAELIIACKASEVLFSLNSLNAASTVTYNVADAQSILAATYGNLKLNPSSTKDLTYPAAGNVIVNGNLTVQANTFLLADKPLVVKGNLTIESGAKIDMSSYNGSEAQAPAANTIDLSGNLTINGTSSTSYGQLVTTPANAKNGIVNFVGTSLQNISMYSNLVISFVNIKVASGSSVKLLSNLSLSPYAPGVYQGTLDVFGTLDVAGYQVMGNAPSSHGSSNTSSAESALFKLESGATFTTQNANGITGSFGATNINFSTNLSTAANYKFSGSAQTLTGLPSTINGLSISGSGDKTLTGPVTVNGSIQFTGGYLKTTTSNLLTVSNSGSVLYASNASFVKGPVKKLGALVNGSFEFPLGAISINDGKEYYMPVIITYPETNVNTSFILTPYTSLPTGTTNSVIAVNGKTASIISRFIVDIHPENWGTTGNIPFTNGVNITMKLNEKIYSGYTQGNVYMSHYLTSSSKWEIPNLGGQSNTNDDVNKIRTLNLLGQKSFSLFGVAESQQALPVLLSSFSAKAGLNNTVNLAWSTSSEIVNKGFRIERQSAIGNGKYENIGFVASKATEGGNSNTTLFYSFVDAAPTSNATNYYRLAQLDLDGKTTYSDVKLVRLGGETVTMVYPNPSNGAVTISRAANSQKLNIQILDMSGKMVQQYSNISDANFKLNINKAGMYNIKMINPASGEQTIQRIVIQK